MMGRLAHPNNVETRVDVSNYFSRRLNFPLHLLLIKKNEAAGFGRNGGVCDAAPLPNFFPFSSAYIHPIIKRHFN